MLEFLLIVLLYTTLASVSMYVCISISDLLKTVNSPININYTLPHALVNDVNNERSHEEFSTFGKGTNHS